MGARPGTNNGGGPKTPEGRARALANLDPLASVKHGAYLRPQAPCCDTCELARATGDCNLVKFFEEPTRARPAICYRGNLPRCNAPRGHARSWPRDWTC